jgi:hypothetical protein
VALKLLKSQPRPNYRARFKREGELAAALDHPGILKVFAGGEADGRPFLVYELVPEAKELDEAMEGLDRRARVRLLRDVAEAVGYAHAEGIVHRDLKHSNVLVDPSGRARVLDFGLAFEPDDSLRLTQTGATLGTPWYMAPEQAAADRKQIGPPADVWALGVLLYHALTDRYPFHAATWPELLAQIFTARPDAPREVDPGLDRALEAVCLRALSRRPEDRHPDAAALAEDLDAWLEGRLRAPAQPAPRWLLVAAGAALPALVVGLAVALIGPGSTTPPTDSPASSPPEGATASPAPPPATPAARQPPILSRFADPAEGLRAAWAWSEANGGPGQGAFAQEAASLARAQPLLVLRHAEGGLVRAAFLDERRLVTFGADGSLARWALPGGELRGRRDLGRPAPDLRALANFPSVLLVRGEAAVVGGPERGLDWVPFGGLPGPLEGPRPYCGVASPRGETFFVGGVGAEVVEHAWEGLELRARFGGHTEGRVLALALSRDGGRLATFAGAVRSQDPAVGANILRVFDVTSGEQLAEADVQAWIRTAAFTADGHGLYVGTITGQILEVDATSGELRGELVSEAQGEVLRARAHLGTLRQVVLSRDGARVFSVSRGRPGENQLACWDPATRQLAWPKAVRPYDLTSAALSPSGDLLAIGTSAGRVEVWAVGLTR